MNIYGVPYIFIPKKPFERTTSIRADEIPDFSEYTSLFKFNIHKNVKGKQKGNFGINDAVEITQYIGEGIKRIVIPPFVNSIATGAFKNHEELV